MVKNTERAGVEALEELIKWLDPNFKYIEHYIQDEILFVEVISSRSNVHCSTCKTPFFKAHSHYLRSFKDLQLQGKKVVILLKNRKLFCSNSDCSTKTFSEIFDCIGYKSKKSNRLIRHIVNTAMNCSTNNTSKLLKKDIVNISKSTICNILKREKIEIDYNAPTRVCIDDFALKKDILTEQF